MKAEGLTPDVLAGRLEQGIKHLDFFAADAARVVSQHIAARGYANAPVLTGKLRSRIEATPVEAKGTGNFVSRVVVQDDDGSLFYAPLMYFFLSPHAVFPLYNLGPISRIQPPTAEGGVGGTWFIRVAEYHRERHLAQLSAGLNALFEFGRYSPLTFI